MKKCLVVEREKKNAIILAFYFFQYSLFMPLMHYVDAMYIVVAVSIIILIASVVINHFRLYMNKNCVLFLLTMLIILLCKILVQGGGFSVILFFLAIACPGVFLVSMDFDKDEFLKFCYTLAIINFIVNCWTPFLTKGYAYMRFGYGMVPSVMFSYIYLLRNREIIGLKKYISLVVFGGALLEILVFGARGSFFSAILFVSVSIILVEKKVIKSTLFLASIGITYYSLPFLLDYLLSVVRSKGRFSYSLLKFKMQLTQGFSETSSGRDHIYRDALEKIRNNPILGNPFNKSISDSYAHNLFLQIALDLGVIALFIFIIFLIYSLYLLITKKNTTSNKLILNCFLTSALGRLMFSSTLWRRPEFWLYVGFVIAISNKENRIIKSDDDIKISKSEI